MDGRPSADTRGVGQLLKAHHHLWDMGRELGLLNDGGEAGIDCLTTLPAYHLYDDGEELRTVGSTVPLVGVGEVIIDVSPSDGPKKYVYQNVQRYISIGMAEQSQRTGNLYATKGGRSI